MDGVRSSLSFMCLFEDCSAVLCDLKTLIGHLSLVHFKERNCKLRCPVGACCKVYSTTESYRKHAQREHRFELCDAHISAAPTNLVPFKPNVESHVNVSVDSEAGVVDGDEEYVVKLVNTLARNVCMFALRTREQYLLPKSTSNAIVTDVSTILTTFFDQVCALCQRYMVNQGCNLACNSAVGNFLCNESVLSSIWSNVSSDAKLKTFCRQQLGLVEAREVLLGTNEVTGKGETCFYIPILDTLKKYLQHDDVWDSYNRSRPKCSDVLYDYTDGSACQNHFLFATNSDAIRLHLYIDDLELCNPLGSAKKKHCISAVYFQVENLEHKHLSSLKSIHVAVVVRTLFLKKYGYDMVLHNLIADIKHLESVGIDICFPGETVRLLGSLSTISADNLASHDIGGFRKSFSSGRVCRFCMVTYNDIDKFISENDDNYPKLRTTHEHKQHILAISSDEKLSAAYGVTKRPAFHELDSFDATLALPPDCMHDILEGVVPLILKVCLRGLISDNIISVTVINERIQMFAFGHSDSRNTPPLFPHSFPKTGLSGSASQKWCLLTNLALLIGDLVPADSQFWELYILCRKMCEIIFAPFISHTQILVLDQIISEHHTLLLELCPGDFTPKCHFVTHYPRLMFVYGPLRHMWCMRFESFHQYLKSIAQNTHNFKNICRTLADRTQMRKCLEQCDVDCLNDDELIDVSQKHVSIRSLPKSLHKPVSNYFACSVESSLITVRSAILLGTEYYVDEFFVLDVVDYDVPVFFQLCYIVSFDGVWALVGHICISSEFVAHYHAYSIDILDEWCVIRPPTIMLHPSVKSHYVNTNSGFKHLILLRHCVLQSNV